MRHDTVRALAQAASRFTLAVLASAALVAASASAADMTANGSGEMGADGSVEMGADGVWVKSKKPKRIYGIRAVKPGMNQTELQSVLGPPDYIQVNASRQAWQYCPHFLERFYTRRGDLIQSMEHLFARRDGNFFITVWFLDGQVEHLRAYPEEAMGNCADFYAAFRWEDIIDGEAGYSDAGVYGGGGFEHGYGGDRSYGGINK